jgi:exonuclease VII large subunit
MRILRAKVQNRHLGAVAQASNERTQRKIQQAGSFKVKSKRTVPSFPNGQIASIQLLRSFYDRVAGME